AGARRPIAAEDEHDVVRLFPQLERESETHRMRELRPDEDGTREDAVLGRAEHVEHRPAGRVGVGRLREHAPELTKHAEPENECYAHVAVIRDGPGLPAADAPGRAALCGLRPSGSRAERRAA